MAELIDSLVRYTEFFPWLTVVAVGLAWEREILPRGRELKPKDSTVINLANLVAACIMQWLFMPAISAATGALLHRFGGGLIALRFPLHNKILSQAATILALLFISDFLYYFWHRAQHRYRALWHIHAVHHSDKSFNITTYVRKHWLEELLQAVVIAIPISLLFRFQAVNLFAAGMVSAAWTCFGHMNIRLDLGRLTGVFCGPQYHRIHHSVEKRHQDVNFVQYFPVIDRLFGTYCPPGRDEYPATGTYANDELDDIAALFLWPFRQWARDFRRRKAR